MDAVLANPFLVEEVLLRAPYASHATLAAVCGGWAHVVRGMGRARADAGFAEAALVEFEATDYESDSDEEESDDEESDEEDEDDDGRMVSTVALGLCRRPRCCALASLCGCAKQMRSKRRHSPMYGW